MTRFDGPRTQEGPRMSNFIWTASMSVGSKIIESDHFALIELINRVGYIATGKGIAKISDVLD